MRKIMIGGLFSILFTMSCQQEQPQPVQTEPKQEVAQPEQKVEVKPEENTPQQPKEDATQQQQQQQPEAQQPKKESSQQQPQPKQSEEKTKPQQTALADGKSIFTSKGCGACHQENNEAVGPSLKKIASVYAGDKAKLTAFLKGEGKPIVDPTKEAIMKPQLEITKKLNSQELEALVDFILKH